MVLAIDVLDHDRESEASAERLTGAICYIRRCVLSDELETRMRYFGMCVTHIYTHAVMCVTHIYTHIAICRKEGVSLQNEEEGENAL